MKFSGFYEISRATVLSIFIFPFLSACGAGSSALRRPPKDIYPDLKTLAAVQVEGRDYSIELYDRKSPVSVFAVHGGDIEYTTSRLARNIAGADLNLYVFSGWLGRESHRLHVTSANFDDPAALTLSSSSTLAVSVHAQAEEGEWVCVGGANKSAAELVASALSGAGFKTEVPCRRLPGTSPRNIVNRAALGGVQLEVSLKLLEKLEMHQAELLKFAGAVRAAVFEVLKKGETK